MPSVNRLYQEFKDKGLAVVLIDFGESPATVKKTVAERGYTAPVLVDESGDTTGRSYGVWGPPTVYLVNRQGRLVGRIAGARDWWVKPAARKLIEDLLAAK